jgi:hypothetical protein
MFKSAFFGLCLSLTAVGSTASAQTIAATHGHVVLTRAQIVRIKALLHLKPDQLQHPIEAVLREMSPHGGHGVALASQAIVLDESKLQRLAAAALPLLMVLGPEQKREASALGRAIGVRLSPTSH